MLLSMGGISGVNLFAIDRDASGLSDLYEATFEGVSINGNADGDWLSDYSEYLFGTNPLDPHDPGASYELVGNGFVLRVPADFGLRFEVFAGDNPGALVGQGIIEAAPGTTGFTYQFDQPARFFRIELLPPLDLDADSLDAWEEAQLGTSDQMADTDLDTLNDDVEYADTGTNPLLLDTDGDGFNANSVETRAHMNWDAALAGLAASHTALQDAIRSADAAGRPSDSGFGRAMRGRSADYRLHAGQLQAWL